MNRMHSQAFDRESGKCQEPVIVLCEGGIESREQENPKFSKTSSAGGARNRPTPDARPLKPGENASVYRQITPSAATCLLS
ncbi:unnamed protein product [Ixodes pacificus]